MRFASVEIDVVFICDDTDSTKCQFAFPWWTVCPIVPLHYCYICLICDSRDKRHMGTGLVMRGRFIPD